ncbi:MULTISPECIES: rubrerythrin-like domain-containing protein [Salinibaculum]
MNRNDPYTPTGAYIYECTVCGARIESEERIGECSSCGGAVQNIAVPRE